MYEDSYDLETHEQTEVQQILTRWKSNGRRHQNAEGQPIAFVVLATRRFLVCENGEVWRYAAKGTPKQFDERGKEQSAPRRNPAIEMWTGHWQKVIDPATGKPTHSKCLIWVSVATTVNARPGLSHIAWYRSRKRLKHPHESPHRPSQVEIDALEGRRQATRHAVLAIMEKEGLDPEGTPAEAPPPTNPPKAPARKRTRARKPKRTNKRASTPKAEPDAA